MEMTEKQQILIQFIKNLDNTKRHSLKIICRGSEPWQIEVHKEIHKIDLKSLEMKNKD